MTMVLRQAERQRLARAKEESLASITARLA